MKQKFLILTLLVVTGLTSFAAPNEKVLESFKKNFVNAQSVTWSETGGYFKASFVLGDHRAEAYFNQEGGMEGCIRDLFYVQLPLVVMTTVDKKFPDAAIIDVREIINAEGTTYRITLESKGKKLRIKSDGSGNIYDTERLKN